MKILIVSDTHSNIEIYRNVLKMEEPLDMIIHCGDSMNADIISLLTVTPIVMVAGNNDFFTKLPKEIEMVLGTYKVLITHGHYYNVSMGTDFLKKEAKDRDIDMVIFGHTHKPLYEVDKGFIMINPGSLAYPRQAGKRGTYIIMEIDASKDAHITIHYL